MIGFMLPPPEVKHRDPDLDFAKEIREAREARERESGAVAAC